MNTHSHFGSLLYEFCKDQELSIRDLSKQVEGTSPSTFSKIRAGNYSKLTEDRLNQILAAVVPENPSARALMVCAYLWDMCPEAYHTEVKIEPNLEGAFSPSEHNEELTPEIKTILPALLSDIARAANANEVFFDHVRSLGKLAKEFTHG
jgi:hypothetical protein